ncbi:MAG: DUF501 domain-containing protein [Actinomycetota bacterium]
MRGAWSVAARCHLGVPMVIENHPRLDDGSPFPTLYWLTCPILTKRVSKLEGEGGMETLNEELARDASLVSRLSDAIAASRARRDAHEAIQDSGAPPGGGPERVKCLHAHTAQELVDADNPIGARSLSSAGYPDCRVACYRVT